MGKIIYIRHGNDKRSRYKHDEKLTSEGKREARELAKNLIEEYGLPDIIYYSPFYRTRQTRKQMTKEIYKYKEENGIDKRIKLQIEPRLGRYFTRKEERNPDISSSTLYKGAIIEETFQEFGKRVEYQLNEVIDNEYNIVWNITHSLVLLKVSKVLNISRSSHVKYLDYCLIEK